MVQLWPFSAIYRAYFGTMKFKERFAFCLCFFTLLLPFLWMRWKLSDQRYPLQLSVSDTQALVDGMDFNRIDHTHRHQRSNDIELRSPSEGTDFKDQKGNALVNRDTWNKEGNNVDARDDVNQKDDTDYEYDDPWLLWRGMVKSRQITSPTDKESVDIILDAMMYKPIIAAGVGYKGTQLKATLILEGKQRVVFKPMRYTRDYIVEGTPYSGFDRHNGEIAAFHLDRILGFYRAPPVVGRKVNLEEEVEPIGEKRLMDTFFKEGGNTCFYGVCYYCKKAEAACANGTIMEGSVTLWLPPGWHLRNWRHPWQRTYRDGIKAMWEIDNNYCKKKVLKTPPYDSGPRLLDIMDTAMFDFLIGNADRHHYETFKDEGDEGMLLHLDNAKSFGNPHHDEMSILAPIYQCCRIRQSTWHRFRSVKNQKMSLSEILRKSAKDDPLAPVLSDLQFKAIDRRLKIAIDTVEKCIKQYGESAVLISDETL